MEPGAARTASPLELGQQCMREGNPAAAIAHLEGALGSEGAPPAAAVDIHLLLAEALWQKSGGGGDRGALPHYEAASKLAQASGDRSKEGMIALGHGFALSQLGDAAAARERLEHARALAEADGNANAVQFVERFLKQVGAPPVPASQTIQDTWRQFAESLSADKPAVLFLRGTLAAPADADSAGGVARLRRAGCERIEVVDISRPGPGVPEGLLDVGQSPHVTFPQLFADGAEVAGWLDVPLEDLRGRLAAAGLALGEPKAEPCHGTAAFSEGLEPWEVALVELVSKDGAGDWPEKAALLQGRNFSGSDGPPALDAGAVEAAWRRLAPVVRGKLEEQPEMPCGHSCSTCPTRHDCQLHDAVDGVADIEDIGKRGG